MNITNGIATVLPAEVAQLTTLQKGALQILLAQPNAPASASQLLSDMVNVDLNLVIQRAREINKSNLSVTIAALADASPAQITAVNAALGL